MADDSLGVLVEFQAKYDTVTQGFNQIAKGTDKVIENNKRAEVSFDELGRHAKEGANTILNDWLGLGIALSAAGLIEFFNHTAESISHLVDTARGLGVTAQDFQRLSYGAALGGVGVDDLSGSLKKFNISLGQALEGNEQIIESFKALGITVENLRGKDIASQYTLVAESASKLKDNNITAANAMAVFGRNYTTALSLGRDGIKENIKEFDELGVTLTDTQNKAAKAFDDAKTKLDTIFSGFFKKVVADSAPAFQKLVDGVSDFITKSGGIEALATNVGNKIVEIVQSTIDTFEALKPGFQFLLDTLDVLISSSKSIFSNVKNLGVTTSDVLSQGGTNAHASDPGVGDYLADLIGFGHSGESLSRHIPLYNLLSDTTSTPFGQTYDPNAIGNYSHIPSIYGTNPNNFLSNTGSTTNPYDNPINNLASNVAGIALKQFATNAEKASKGMSNFNDSIQKSSDLITAAYKTLDNKDLGDAINRIFNIINPDAKQTQDQYDAQTKADLASVTAAGGNIDQFNLNRQLNRPADAALTTSADFDKSAADLIQQLKAGGLSSNAYNAQLRSLNQQSQYDLTTGQNSAEQKVIEEIQKYATSLGVNKQQVEVGITVSPTKDFAVKVFTNADVSPYLAAGVAEAVAAAAGKGALS